MTYVTGDIPVGAYQSTRLSNIGIGHGAIDAGGGYTYFNPQTGHEFSGVLGVTYNFKNTATQYQSGVDLHFDADGCALLCLRLDLGEQQVQRSNVMRRVGPASPPWAGSLV